MLALMRTAYSQSDDPTEMLDTERFPSRIQIETHLLDRSIEAVVAISSRHPNDSAAVDSQRRWLASLAAVMNADISHSFAWWRLVMTTPVPSRVTSWIASVGPIMVAGTVGVLASNWQIAIAAAAPVVIAFTSTRKLDGKSPYPAAHHSARLASTDINLPGRR